MNNLEFINLVACFDHDSRLACINDMKASLDYFENEEMLELVNEAIDILENMSDKDFSLIDFDYVFEDDDDDH